MPTMQEAGSDATDELVALLVPPRRSRIRSGLLCLAVVAALGGFAELRTFGVVVPRLHAQLQSSAVGPAGDLTVVMRLANDGQVAARIESVDATEAGLSGPTVVTHLPLTLGSGKSIDLTMHWNEHKCRALTSGEARHFRVRAHTGLPIAIERDYPVRTSDTFHGQLDPPPAPGESGDEFTTSGDFGGWVMDALRFACEYGR